MVDNKNNKNQNTEETPIDRVKRRSFAKKEGDSSQKFSGGRKPYGKRDNKGGRRVQEKSEFDQKTIDMRRVTRVVSGGRRFSLSVSVAIGDHNGRVGFGSGKALDTQAAIEKAVKNAKKHLLKLNLGKNNALPFDVETKYKSATVWISPNKEKGIIAGSSARAIFELAGINNVTAKFRSGTKNKINNAKATMKALSIFTR